MSYEDEYEAAETLSRVLLSISAACALATLATLVCLRPLWNFTNRLVCFLCVTIIFSDICLILTSVDRIVDSSFCKGIAAILHFSLMANYCWTCIVTFNFFVIIVRRSLTPETLHLLYHGIGWGVPSVLCIAAGASSSYGRAGGGCFFEKDEARFATFFVPGFLIITFNAILFVFLVREVRETMSLSGGASTIHSRRVEFLSYFVFFSSSSFSWLLGYVLYTLDPNTPEHVAILILFTIAVSLQGACVFASYALSKRAVHEWRYLLGQITCLSPVGKWETRGAVSSSTASTASSSAVLD
mmetsp:Transcript_3723/g.10206  ORF Transcript_3723/g.10206 Transcript_3723/m.10206 type:complete len:299 (-) Transcript_3723:54-950(-)|eukprot:CAMPEP_0119133458 /NCGR_PEP_ID=MMETSP1310-20130426/13384_1 /TAXON_ID=464262 /ORGANISM="Genus nov. species nov., Strain RCC2339" /LENGTH=298 /DNA_ID=CAMNT_0007124149 /DNA_START=249 /DNA_END=1145 /DNA_ORIENTATION=-